MRTILLNRMLPLLTLLLVLAVPASSSAQATGIGFRNETPMPVVVQGGSIVNGIMVRGQPMVILPGRVAVDVNLGLGIREITIYDPNLRNRILLRQNVPFQGRDMFFMIRPNPQPNPFPLVLVAR